MTAQEVIKSFIKKLANHGYASSSSVGVDMLDSATRAASRYANIQEVIDAMKADQTAAEIEAVEEVLGSNYAGKTMSELPDSILNANAKDYDTENKSNAYYNKNNDNRSTVENLIKERMADIFLEKYCGIVLNEKFWFNSSGTVKTWNVSTGNSDTGAITGKDAGGSTTKTKSSVVPEIFINTYTASTSTPQNIITNDRDWVVQATANSDTITSNGADSINAGSGSDSIVANANGATITSGDGNDVITISEGVTDIIISDLNSYDTLTINGTFNVGSAQVEDNLLVIADKTGTRKIRLGDLTNAKNAKINSITISKWLANAGITLENLNTKNYADDKVVSNSSVNDNAAVIVDLNKVDTSATGSVTVSGSVVGNLSSTFPNASIFTRNGLTLHLLGVTSDTYGSYNNIQAKTFDQLTDDQKIIIAGLFKWWIAGGLDLSEESYGISFNSSSASVKDIGLFFYDGQGLDTTLAAVQYWQRDGDSATNKLLLKVNMNYFAGIASNDVDGNSSNSSIKQILDRVLAHELTHANMQSNINFFSTLPQFIVEGSAELIHGIDDERGNRIFSIAADTSKLSTVLNVKNIGTGDADCYAGGYMFLRYFAKTAAAQTLPAFGEITATVNPDSDGSYYISGNSTSETASTTAQAIKLGTVSNGVYTVENTGVHQVITNTNNLKIAGLTVNDTLIGSDAADIINTAEGSFVTSGKGNDSITINGQYATISAGAGDDTVIATNGSHHFLNLGSGNDYAQFNAGSVYNNTIAVGAGDDYIYLDTSYNSSIVMGAGNDSIYFGGQNNTISTGDSNDTIKFRYSNDSENFIELGAGNDRATIYGDNNTLIGGADNDYFYNDYGTNTVFKYTAGEGNDLIDGFNSTSRLIIGGGLGTYAAAEKNSDVILTIGNGFVTLRNAASLSTLNIEGKEGTSNLVEGTENADTISNAINEVTIMAYGGDDLITNSGTNVLIDGGADNDSIRLSGTGATIDVSTGDDTISFDNNIKSFQVVGFGSGDVIQLNSRPSNLETIDGGLIVGSVTISGAQMPTTVKAWSLSNNVATHNMEISAGATLSENNKSIVYGAASSESVTVSGIGKTTGLEIDTDKKIVTVQAAALNEQDVTISDGYTLALGDDAPTPTTTESTWHLNDTTATYGFDITAGYTLADNKITYTAASDGDLLVTVSGVGSTSGLKINTSRKIVTVQAASLNEQDVTISEGYKLRLGSVSAPVTTAAAWNLSGTTATYKSSGTTAGYTLDDDKITYTAASDGDLLVTVSGVGSTSGLEINTADKIVTVNESALNEQDVTISKGYSLALGDAPTPTATDGTWSISKTTATYKASGTTAGYTLADNKITYTAASDGDLLVTVSGVGSTSGLEINTADKIVTVNESALNEQDVTISKGYSLALGDAPTPTATDGTWSISKTTATYKASGTTAGYTLADNKINYTAASDGETLIELRGIATAPTVKGNTVQLSKDNFSNDVSIVSGGNYKFELKDENYSGKIFSGSKAGDNITNNGSSVTINGGKGNDTLTGGKYKDFLSGDAGNDILNGGKGNDIFAYSGGNDLITDYEKKDKISLSSAYENFSVNGKDLIFNFGDDSLTLTNGAGKEINFIDGKEITTNIYTADGIFNKKKKSVTLSASAENFSAENYSKLVTIDGSATGAIEIVGNKKKNIIHAGNSGTTLNGGKGLDTLYGGAGADIFVYENKSGKDVIEGYGTGDKINLDSKVTIKSVKTKKGDTVLKFKGGALTVKDTTEFNIGDTLYSGGVFIAGDSAKVYSSYKGTLNLADYAATNVDASLAKKKLTITGTDSANSLQGGKGKDILSGGAGLDTLWGGKGNDTLTGGDGNDVFIYQAGQGKDFITDYEAGDMLQIFNNKGNDGTFTDSTFTGSSLTLNIQGGGKVTFDNVAASSTFNINGESYHISNQTLTKD